MRNLVSVVVPTYNRDYVLGRALDSVLAQTHHNLEVIVVDDGSTDATRTLVQERYGHDPRVRYVYQENRGVSAARNRGFKEVRGDYAALLDSDDVWRPWKLELQLRCLAQLPDAGMIWTDMEAIDPAGRVFDGAYLRTMYSAYHWFQPKDLFDKTCPVVQGWPDAPAELRDATVYGGEIYSQMIMGNLVHTSTVLLRRERLEKVGFFSEELRVSGEDYDFHLRTCRAGRVAFVNVASIQYQTGMSDRLTRPEYNIHIAQNFLKTISPAIERDRDRIHLPPRMIDDVLSGAHGWIGEAAFDLGDRSTARQHLFKSLLIHPWQVRRAALLMLSMLPQWVSVLSRQVYASIKHILAPGPAPDAVNANGK
jgi:glycosyltransferase involved in cell wall biosynthesis